MIDPVKIPPPGFDQLSVDEQIIYVQELWDRISADPDQVPIPDWHREVIRERLERLAQNPEPAEPWPVVRERLERKLRGDVG